MILPNVIFVGPQKTGTTWIYSYLKLRGDIGLPRNIKETFYFDKHHDRGLAWYAKHFSSDERVRLWAEIAPTYFHKPLVVERIRNDLGEIPIMITLREPVKRTYSQYVHCLHYGWTRRPFRSAIEKIPAILEPSRYATHMKNWLKMFDRSKVHVFFQEELISDPNAFVMNICEQNHLPFLPVPEELKKKVHEASLPSSYLAAKTAFFVSNTIRHIGLYRLLESLRKKGWRRIVYGKPGEARLPRLSGEDRRWVYNKLEGEIEELEGLLGIDLSRWKLGNADDKTDEAADDELIAAK